MIPEPAQSDWDPHKRLRERAQDTPGNWESWRWFSLNMNEETAKPGTEKNKHWRKTKAGAGAGVAGSCRQTFNFVLSQLGTREPLLFMVPVRWKEGRKEGRAGLPLGGGWETVGPGKQL